MVDNFKQAWREVFSFGKASGNNQDNGTNQVPPQNNPVPAVTGKEPVTPKGPEKKEENPYLNKPLPKPKYDEPNTTYITKSTIIQGTIKTDSDLKIAGKIEGNVEGRNIAVIGGQIVGDISCTNTEIDDAHIEGNISASEVIDVGKNNLIIGNISANRGKLAGKVKGDVNIVQDLEVEEDAVILGDITADLISIKKGAAIQGNMVVRRKQISSIAQKIEQLANQEGTDPSDS